MELLNSLGIGGIIAIAAYVVIAIVECVLGFLEKETARKIVKVFCLIPLLALTIILIPDHRFIRVALLFGLLGDIGLLSRRKVPFFLGNIAFLLEHVAIILEIYFYYFPYVGGTLPYYYFIIFGVIYIALIAIFVKKIYKLCGSLPQALLGLNYMIIVIMMCLTTLVSSIYHYQWILISFIGYLFFLISDSIIVVTTFKKDIKRRHFYIMSTYLIAQFLIVFGFVLTYIQ